MKNLHVYALPNSDYRDILIKTLKLFGHWS